METNSTENSASSDLFVTVFIIGFIIGLVCLSLTTFFEIQILYSLAAVGGLIMISPFLGFQIAMTANEAGPGVDFSDMKHAWFWAFYGIVFPLFNILFFSGVNYLSKLVPEFITVDKMLSLDYLKAASPYVVILYVALTVAGIAWRLAVKHKNVYLA